MKKQHGFTLVELITVMLIVGILSAAAFSRFADNRAYNQSLFSSKVQAYFKLAQQIAIAQQTDSSARTSISFNKTSDAIWNIEIKGIEGSLNYDIASHENLHFNDTMIDQQNQLTLFYRDNGDIEKQRISAKSESSNTSHDNSFDHSSTLKIGSQLICIVPTGYSYEGSCI